MQLLAILITETSCERACLEVNSKPTYSVLPTSKRNTENKRITRSSPEQNPPEQSSSLKIRISHAGAVRPAQCPVTPREALLSCSSSSCQLSQCNLIPSHTALLFYHSSTYRTARPAVLFAPPRLLIVFLFVYCVVLNVSSPHQNIITVRTDRQ